MAELTDHHLPDAPACPTCGAVLDGALETGALETGAPGAPTPGALSVCAYCAGLHTFVANDAGGLELQAVTDDEHAQLTRRPEVTGPLCAAGQVIARRTPPPERLAGELTPAYLARVLAMFGAPAHMASLAAEGHYDDYVGPLAMPQHQLLADVRAEGLAATPLTAWTLAGCFDATKAESDAWANSAEGRATFDQLTRPNRAQRRRQQRGR